jgi:signal transduction histidine kinase
MRTGDEFSGLGGETNRMTDIEKNYYSDLERKVDQRTRQVSALYEITGTLNRSLDLDRVLPGVVERINQIFQFDGSEVYLWDSERNHLIARAAFTSDSSLRRQGQGSERTSNVARQVCDSGQAVVFDDVKGDPRYAEITGDNCFEDAEFRFLAVLPIKVPGKNLGALRLRGKESRTLGDDDVELLTSMCEHIALAVEKANLFDQLMTRFRHLEALNTIGAAVSQSLNLDEVLDRAVDKIAKTLAFDAVWIYHFDAVDSLSQMKAFYGLGDDMAAGMGPRSADAGINRQVIETGERVVCEDLEGEQFLRPKSWQGSVRALGFKSVAAFPVKTKEHVIGALHIANRSRRRFGAEDLQLIESIAQQIGVATENALLFAEIKRKTQELAKTNQELLEATQAKSEFIAAMSHELRTPLNVVIGSSDLLRDGFFGTLTDGQKEATNKISRNARVLLKMINDVLTISRFDAKRMSVDISTVAVEAILEQARELVEQINRDNRLEVRWKVEPGIPPLTTDALKIEEILQNLISNAFKFTPSGFVEIQVNHRPEKDRVEFSVADSGIGIPEEDIGRIFNAFEQLNDAHTGHFSGVGLGLNIVRRYLELLDGDISVESKPGAGAKFTFSIPRTL